MAGNVFRYAAFTTTPDGGNPAGVWIGDALPPAEKMQSIAAEVACPVTAFLAPGQGLERKVRYFSAEREVDLCGHATIASGVHFGRTLGEGEYRFATRVGELPVSARRRGTSRPRRRCCGRRSLRCTGPSRTWTPLSRRRGSSRATGTS
jgi:PhzF family phenazine biosynthesis protein